MSPERLPGEAITSGHLLERAGGLPAHPEDTRVNRDVIVDYVQEPLSQEQMDEALIELAAQIEQQAPPLPQLDTDNDETEPAVPPSASNVLSADGRPAWWDRAQWEATHHRLPRAVVTAPTD